VTPREFDSGVVQARLRLIDDLLNDLASIGEVTADRLHDDRILRHAVERVLSQLVELAVSVNSHVASTMLHKAPSDYRGSFDLASTAGLLDGDLRDRLKPSVGLRNVLAHEYVAIDLALVAAAARSASHDYRAYVEAVAWWLRDLR
jgi:uncharacterized protein YutE (UPF0331/DUF86 family)